jgi:hypothetical protein
MARKARRCRWPYLDLAWLQKPSGTAASEEGESFDNAGKISNGSVTVERVEKGASEWIRMDQVGSFYINSKPNSSLRSTLGIQIAPNGEWGAYSRRKIGTIK